MPSAPSSNTWAGRGSNHQSASERQQHYQRTRVRGSIRSAAMSVSDKAKPGLNSIRALQSGHTPAAATGDPCCPCTPTFVSPVSFTACLAFAPPCSTPTSASTSLRCVASSPREYTRPMPRDAISCGKDPQLGRRSCQRHWTGPDYNRVASVSGQQAHGEQSCMTPGCLHNAPKCLHGAPCTRLTSSMVPSSCPPTTWRNLADLPKPQALSLACCCTCVSLLGLQLVQCLPRLPDSSNNHLSCQIHYTLAIHLWPAAAPA